MEEWVKCTFRNISLSKPTGIRDYANTAVRTHTHIWSHTAGGYTLQVGAVLLRAGWKETLKLQRGKDRWPVWQLRTLMHTHTHQRTRAHQHKLLPPQTPCCAHLWKCQILDSTSFNTPSRPPPRWIFLFLWQLLCTSIPLVSLQPGSPLIGC